MNVRKIILTGFQPFGNYTVNPVQQSTEYFHDKIIGHYGRRKVIGIVLPATYLGAFQVLSAAIDELKPGAIISTGLASSAQGIRIETRFHNMMCGKYPDNDGYAPDNVPIKQVARDFYDATADPTLLTDRLNAKNIPNEISDDADRFICNSLGYLTTRKIVTQELHITNTFIHVPWTDEYRNEVTLSPEKMYMQKAQLYEALELLLNAI